jgi:hypothetical protein
VIKRLALIVSVMGATLFTSGCVQDMWAAFLKGAGNYVTATTTQILTDRLPF